MEEKLVEYCLANVGLAGLIGARLYPLLVPPEVDDQAVAYQVISEVKDYVHGGPAGSKRSRVQLTCTAARYGLVKGLARAVDAAVDASFDVTLALPLLQMKVDNVIDQPRTVKTERFVVRVDVMVWHCQ